KANVVADALSTKEQEPPLRVRALVMTIGLDLPRQILNAQTEARKPKNIKKEDVGADMPLASSAVTYTSVYTDSEPGRDEDEHKPMFIQPHDLDFVKEPIYPEYIPLEDEHILSAEVQPLPPVVSPTAESPEYVAESNPEEDPEEYEDDEAEDGLVDYPIDRGDDEDDDDRDSSRDNADDEDEDEEDEEEEEDHLAPADSAIGIPTDELAAISFPLEAEVERLLSMPTPSPSPLTSLSPPSTGERLAKCMAPTALPLPPLPPPLHMLPPVDRRDDIPETEMPHCKRLCLSTLGSRYKARESSTARTTEGRWIDYGFIQQTEIAELQETNRRHQAQMADSPSDKRHKVRDGRHAGRVISTAWEADESWTAMRGC
nr:reverse transcriptase domain-containing protein [Tanacetum cinerariifolium]